MDLKWIFKRTKAIFRNTQIHKSVKIHNYVDH